jgi:NAD-dependent SIR2 family protein deacetylase
MQVENLGEYDLTCGQCDHSYTGDVYLRDGYKKLSACPSCGRTCVVLGIDL